MNPRNDEPRTVFIIAGEASGDMHGAALVRHLARLRPDLDFVGIGGDALAAAGVRTIFTASEMNVAGFLEVVRRYRFLRSAFDATLAEIRRLRPALAILVDYPGFNLRMARALRGLGIPVVYYIAPQVWAWKEGRVDALRRYVDELIVVFPFEVEYFARHGIEARFFGHPLIDVIASRVDGSIREDSASPAVAYLPGSRAQEIERHMPLISEVAARLGDGVRHLVPRAATVDRVSLERHVHEHQRRHGGAARIEIVEGSEQALQLARAALVKAGTSTLETALYGVPFAAYYQTSRLSYEIARRAIKVGSITLVNLLAGRPVVREFVQKDAEPEAIAAELRLLLEEGEYRRTMLEALLEVRKGLGDPGAAERAAQHIATRYL